MGSVADPCCLPRTKRPTACILSAVDEGGSQLAVAAGDTVVVDDRSCWGMEAEVVVGGAFVEAVAAEVVDCMVSVHAVLAAEDAQAGQVVVVAAALQQVAVQARERQVVVRAKVRRALELGELVKEAWALLRLTETCSLSRLLPSASLAGLSAR